MTSSSVLVFSVVLTSSMGPWSTGCYMVFFMSRHVCQWAFPSLHTDVRLTWHQTSRYIVTISTIDGSCDSIFVLESVQTVLSGADLYYCTSLW
ncbi:hypothetical protein V8E52_010558 [Russula decolorans]